MSSTHNLSETPNPDILDPPTCILTDAPGEDPDDCLTHDHEVDESSAPAFHSHLSWVRSLGEEDYNSDAVDDGNARDDHDACIRQLQGEFDDACAAGGLDLDVKVAQRRIVGNEAHYTVAVSGTMDALRHWIVRHIKQVQEDHGVPVGTFTLCSLQVASPTPVQEDPPRHREHARAAGDSQPPKSSSAGELGRRCAYFAQFVGGQVVMCLAVEDEAGYQPLAVFPGSIEEAELDAEARNAELGLSPRRAYDIIASSLAAQKHRHLGEEVIKALRQARDDLDDASSVVDPGEGEQCAYETTLALLNDLLEQPKGFACGHTGFQGSG